MNSVILDRNKTSGEICQRDKMQLTLPWQQYRRHHERTLSPPFSDLFSAPEGEVSCAWEGRRSKVVRKLSPRWRERHSRSQDDHWSYCWALLDEWRHPVTILTPRLSSRGLYAWQNSVIWSLYLERIAYRCQVQHQGLGWERPDKQRLISVWLVKNYAPYLVETIWLGQR